MKLHVSSFSFCGAFWCRRTAVFPPCTICWMLNRIARVCGLNGTTRRINCGVFGEPSTPQVRALLPGCGRRRVGWVWGCDTAYYWWRSPSGDIWAAHVTQFTEYQMFRSPVVWIGEMIPPTAWHQWSVAPAAAGGRAPSCHLLIGLETIKRIIMSRRGPTSR